MLFPFQPCKISAFPKEFPKGIYLANEKDLKNTICGYLYDSKPKSFPWALMADPFNDSSAKFINVYEGPMFLTASDTFRTGPHTGQSLLQVYKKEPSIIEKYILTDHMYVSTNALKELKDLENIKDNNRAFSMLLATRDSKLSFMPINDITDEIRGIGAYNSEERLFHVTFQASWYNKMTLVDVFKKDPQYIISLVELNDIHIESSVLDKLENNDRIQELRNSLKKQKERQEESCDRYNSEYESYMLKMEIEDGLKEAYNSDPDALWNTD